MKAALADVDAGRRQALANQLAGLLKSDDNWGVRERAAKALLGIHSTEIYGALVRSTIEDDDDDVSLEEIADVPVEEDE